MNTEEPKIESSKTPSTTDASGTAGDATTELENLTAKTKYVYQIFIWAGYGLIFRIILIFTAITFLIGYLHNFYHEYLDIKIDEKMWTWHYTIIKITVISIFISAIAFCLMVLLSYIHLYKHNRQKIAVIKAMPTLIYAIGDEEQNKIAYARILEMILHVGNMGIINKEEDKETITLNSFVELFKKVSEKGK